MKRAISLALSAVLALPLASPALAAGDSMVTRIDLVTQQGNGYFHPQQVGIERTLTIGAPQPERIKMTPVPAKSVFGMAAVAGSQNVYVTDPKNGEIWELDPHSGKVFRRFAPSVRPSANLQGIATGLGEDLYVYYNGDGTIQRLRKDGAVVDSFAAPTPYGHSLAYKDNILYVLDDRGQLFLIDAYYKTLIKKIQLNAPDGAPFQQNQTFTLMWDGKYWNVANAQDNWKLYRYDTEWTYHDTVDLQQWSITGSVFTGREYLVLNNDHKTIFTYRLVDSKSGEVETDVSDNYQYVGNVLTTTLAASAFPRYEDHNIALIYNDPRAITQELLRPYVSFLDESGARKGDMFDTFLFLPTFDKAEESFYKQSKPGAWSDYIQKTMSDITAFDREWGEKNEETKQLGRGKVFLAVPYPNPEDDLEARKDMIHKYLDEAHAAFAKQKFANVELRGFYWYNEYVDYAEPLVVDYNQYVHQKGLLSLWIPYQVADQANNYKALGFDEVFHQPNYFFKEQGNSANLNRFFNVAQSGARYGKGVEIELNEKVLGEDKDYEQRFKDYLHYGLVQGYLGGSKAWYDNFAIGVMHQRNYQMYKTIHQVIDGEYQEPDLKIHEPTQGPLYAQSPELSIPDTAKIRLNVITDNPYNVQKVIVHTNAANEDPMTYIGSLRVDEEIALKDGQLVKQEIGQSADGIRIGFNVPIKNDVQVFVVPKGSSPFVDIGRYHPAGDAITELFNKGVLSGMVQNGKMIFNPNAVITRAQFAVMLSNAYELDSNQAVTYSDSVNAWYSPYVSAVSQNEYMMGYDQSAFGPDDVISQEQVAVILMRILNKQDLRAPSKTDKVSMDGVSSWARDMVAQAANVELFDEKFGSSPFQPSAPATRADVAMLLNRAIELRN